MIEKGDLIRAQVANFGSEGEGVCLIDGFPVFVKGALPSEEISATITQVKKRFATAKLGMIHRASPERALPTCRFYEDCGGCSMMHAEYICALKAKSDMVKNALWHIGRIPPESYELEPPVPSPLKLAYRNKAVYHVDENTRKLGFFAENSRSVAFMDECLLQRAESNLAKEIIEKWMREYGAGGVSAVMIRQTRAGGVMIALMCRDEIPFAEKLAAELRSGLKKLESIVHCLPLKSDAPGKTVRVLFGNKYVSDTLCGMEFSLSPQAFFQVNPEQTESLYEKAMEYLKPDRKSVIDAYCGVGTMALLAAKRGAAHVCGIDCVAEAIENARANAVKNGVSNASFVWGNVENALPTLLETRGCDAILLDPPRKGADAKTLAAIADAGISEIVYVSCNPATLARDSAILAEHGYRLEKITPFDMFPQTPHIETISLFLRERAEE